MDDILYLKKYLKEEQYEDGLKRLKKGEAIQYIVGNVNFYGNTIDVNKNVLIPRFETELLVEKTISYIKSKFDKNIRIIDLGTGSGCIAISLKKVFKDSIIDAVDISDLALEVASSNAISNNVDINFYLGDMLQPLNKKYDVIISNPPYIDYNETIDNVVKNNEPHNALYAKEHGLFYYKEILSNCSKYLNSDFIIAFEIGYLQAAEIEKMAYNYLNNINIKVEKDLTGKDRYIFIESV